MTVDELDTAAKVIDLGRRLNKLQRMRKATRDRLDRIDAQIGLHNQALTQAVNDLMEAAQ